MLQLLNQIFIKGREGQTKSGLCAMCSFSYGSLNFYESVQKETNMLMNSVYMKNSLKNKSKVS